MKTKNKLPAKRYNCQWFDRCGFTLIELLVVVAILTLLISILLPALNKARLQTKMVMVKSDLRNLGVALEMYEMDFRGHPAAFSFCAGAGGERIKDYHEYPQELHDLGYMDAVLEDPFNRTEVNGYSHVLRYKYKKPGWARGENLGWTKMGLWVPQSFPWDDANVDPESLDKSEIISGFHYEAKESPVKYAVWSVGTMGDVGFTNTTYLPVSKFFWYSLTGDHRKGILTMVRTEKDHLFSY